MFFRNFNRTSLGGLIDRAQDFIVKQASRMATALNFTRDDLTRELQDADMLEFEQRIIAVLPQSEFMLERYQYVDDLPLDVEPNANLLIENRRVVDEYGYVIEFDVFDEQNNFVGRSTSLVQSDTLLTKEQVINDAQTNNTFGTPPIDLAGKNVDVTSIFKKAS